MEIADVLLGETPGLLEDVEERRQCNHTSFLKCVAEDDGFKNYDVPAIAYKFCDIWDEDVVINENYVKDGYVQHCALKPKDLEQIEYHMRMILAGSNRVGKLHVLQGWLLPHTSTRPDRGSLAT